MNEMIRHKEVRVIDADGTQLGVMPTDQAIEKAYEKGLDLILIVPNANPPVCRISDPGKLVYELDKKQKKAKKSSKAGLMKEIKLSAKIGEHDFLIKANHAREFLQKGYKVKFTLMFKGREMTHPEVGKKHMDRMIEILADVGKPDSPYSMDGKSIVLLMSPKTKWCKFSC